MEFRWVAFITLWTCFIGPILGAPSKSGTPARKSVTASVQVSPHTLAQPHVRR